MKISAPFIQRPVMTVLLMVALVAFGLFGYSDLPVSELPAVDFPTISVSASLPGADPQTMASAVATPPGQLSSPPFRQTRAGGKAATRFSRGVPTGICNVAR